MSIAQGRQRPCAVSCHPAGNGMEGSNLMSYDRERGIVLRELDREALSDKALAHLRAMYPTTEWTAARPDERYAVAVIGDRTWVVCGEGVGWEVKWEKPLMLTVATSWRDDDGVHSQFTATTPVYLSKHEVEQLAEDHASDVDLADLVRAFGDRLEGNFSIWHRTLTEAAS